MKTIFILFLTVILANGTRAQQVNFKDDNLKNAILKQVDANSNGLVDLSEAEATEKLLLDVKNIADLSGLEYFKNLKKLNLRKNNIQDFKPLNQLINLEELVIGDNPTRDSLDLDQLIHLKALMAYRLGLRSLNLPSRNIVNLYLQGNLFEKFDASNYPELESLTLSDCKEMIEVNLLSNGKLKSVYVDGTGIKQLDVSGNPALKYMYVEPKVKVIKGTNQEKLKPGIVIYQAN